MVESWFHRQPGPRAGHVEESLTLTIQRIFPGVVRLSFGAQRASARHRGGGAFALTDAQCGVCEMPRELGIATQTQARTTVNTQKHIASRQTLSSTEILDIGFSPREPAERALDFGRSATVPPEYLSPNGPEHSRSGTKHALL